MTTLTEIENLAAAFATARTTLIDRAAILKTELEQVTQRELPGLRQAAEQAAEAEDRLRNAIDDARQLFEKPRSQVMSGIRCGVKKQKGQVVIDDEAATIARIRKQLPEEQAELLIRRRESVHKPSVYDLTAADLKRLGIRLEDTDDAVVVKPVASALDKLIDAWLAEASEEVA